MKVEVAAWMLLAVVGCRPDPVHPSGAAALPAPADEVVASVGTAKVGVAEATEFARRHPGATVDDLVERELLARHALAEGVSPELPRKRAMVRALLADEFEKGVTIDQVDPDVLAEETTRAEAELKGVGGLQAIVVRIGIRELFKRKQEEISAERMEELREIAERAARRIYATIPADGAAEAALGVALATLEPELLVDLQPDIKLLDARDQREPPQGWVSIPPLAAQLATMPDGSRSDLLQSPRTWMFAVRTGAIEPQPADPAGVRKLAEERALMRLRQSKLTTFVQRLREGTPVSLSPEALEESL